MKLKSISKGAWIIPCSFAVFWGIDSRADAVYNLSAGLNAGQMPERIVDKSGGGAVK